MQTIVYLHGLNATHLSFSYMLKELPPHKAIQINYDSHQRLDESIKDVARQLPKTDFSIVGHSLGGLIAAVLAARYPEAKALVAISSPFGGSKIANIARWIPGHPDVMADITPSSHHVQEVKNLSLELPTLSIISTAGHLRSVTEPNDGVVAVASQKALPFGQKAEVQANHFEVLTHDQTVRLVADHLFGAQQ